MAPITENLSEYMAPKQTKRCSRVKPFSSTGARDWVSFKHQTLGDNNSSQGHSLSHKLACNLNKLPPMSQCEVFENLRSMARSPCHDGSAAIHGSLATCTKSKTHLPLSQRTKPGMAMNISIQAVKLPNQPLSQRIKPGLARQQL